ncbi:nuclear transport factor 2 family protein [Streptomyces sp. SID8014]|uniref:nuclear transport factor 2 family protein n=1 Tax=Streptomyces sp. SID8014 TaxID=2706097 RepID=UPI0013BCD0AA|nr:nuclear transport factor 2 family protein [Streptomyces sp. SID8014]NEC12348.1 nuclear transport factor 2 family protein [Streptomyces sp. SID8014]
MPIDNGRPPTPAEIFGAALESLNGENLDGLIERCTDDVVFEFPFAPNGKPRRIEGKDQVRDYLGALPGIEITAPPSIDVHQTTDPDKAVIEMRATGRVTTTGAPFDQSYVVVLVVSDGLISRYRDYWNPLVALETEKSA